MAHVAETCGVCGDLFIYFANTIINKVTNSMINIVEHLDLGIGRFTSLC